MDFTKLTLVQGLEEILVSPQFAEGQDIVTVLEELIARQQVRREGKVLTLISERAAEEAVVENILTGAEQQTEQRPEPHWQQLQQSEQETQQQQNQFAAPVLNLARRLQQLLDEDATNGHAMIDGLRLYMQEGQPVAGTATPRQDAMQLLSDRINRLPRRYHDILGQLLTNWEAQVQRGSATDEQAKPDNENTE